MRVKCFIEFVIVLRTLIIDTDICKLQTSWPHNNKNDNIVIMSWYPNPNILFDLRFYNLCVFLKMPRWRYTTQCDFFCSFQNFFIFYASERIQIQRNLNCMGVIQLQMLLNEANYNHSYSRAFERIIDFSAYA